MWSWNKFGMILMLFAVLIGVGGAPLGVLAVFGSALVVFIVGAIVFMAT